MWAARCGKLGGSVAAWAVVYTRRGLLWPLASKDEHGGTTENEHMWNGSSAGASVGVRGCVGMGPGEETASHWRTTIGSKAWSVFGDVRLRSAAGRCIGASDGVESGVE